jgi:hypothetical protein
LSNMVRVRLADTMNPRPTYMGEPRLLCHIMPPLLFVGIKKGAKSFVTFVISHFIPNLFFFSEGMQIVSMLEAMNSYVGMHLPYALPCTNSQLLEERTICMFGRFLIRRGIIVGITMQDSQSSLILVVTLCPYWAWIYKLSLGSFVSFIIQGHE